MPEINPECSQASGPQKIFSWPYHRYMSMYRQSLEDPESFWATEARKLNWAQQWDKVLDWQPPYARWFVGGKINASYQCLDRHVKTWRRSKVAIYWEGENGETRTLSYSTLFREVNQCADVLLKLGVKKGDIVALYLPMITELPVFMLACARIGAVHTVVFSGLSAQSLGDRINDCEAKVVVTADGGYRRGKIFKLKETADIAVKNCPSVEKILVVKRTGEDVAMVDGRDYWYRELIDEDVHFVAPEAVESTHPLYILYTSGTTGKPKGVVHSTGGYMVFNHSTFKWIFDIREDSVFWCTADIGWVTGHSYAVYGPLSHGAAIVLYEGSPDYPTIDRWWDIIEKYSVNIFYTSPTAIRMFMKYGEEYPVRHNLSSLELLASVGEPISAEAWCWYYKHIGQEKCPIVDTWWQTETGGFMIAPSPGIEPMPLKPGSATLPLPGIDVAILDAEGNELGTNQKGYLVIKKPWPGMLLDIYGDSELYKKNYWSRFTGVYYPGDYAMRDEDGYFWLYGRADEVLKVAGHRIGTAEIESSVAELDEVTEAAVASRPDEVKGEAIVLFISPKAGYKPSDELKKAVVGHIRKNIGPIAAPDEIYFVQSLPKTRSGKIMRRVLKAVASNQGLGDLSTIEDQESVTEVKKAYEALKGYTSD